MKPLPVYIKHRLDTYGYAYLEHFEPEASTFHLANQLGKTLEISGIPAVQRIVPRNHADAPKNLYSGNYGLQEFPLHTDLAHWYIPPRYLILRCIVPAPHVFIGLVDFSTMVTDIPPNTILRAQFLPRRKLSGKKYLLRLLQKIEGQQVLRWDSLFIIPANREGREVSDHISNFGVATATTRITFTSPSDTLIVDNWRMLHGRSSVPSTSVMRIIERAYLSAMNL
jgi:L-asparagine oxygenase